MEVILNIAWALLAAAMVVLWLRYAPRGCDRRLQVVSLAMLLAILLPAISMTDDLVRAQNPAEIDCCLRRDHEHAHPIFPVLAALPVPAFTRTSLRILCLLTPGVPRNPAIDSPALSSIQNRPPPLG
jgi:hypothetical protein